MPLTLLRCGRYSSRPLPLPCTTRATALGYRASPVPFWLGPSTSFTMATLVASSDDVRIYECAVLYPYALPQKEEAALVKEIEGYFEEVGAKLVAKDAWGRRGLAYPVKGAKEANVTIYYWEMDPLKVKEVDQSLKISKGVLRHLFVKPPKNYQIVKYSDAYEQWLKERESVDQKRTREKQEKLQEAVAAKARRKAQLKTTEKKPVEKTKATGEQMTQQIDKLLTDDLDTL